MEKNAEDRYQSAESLRADLCFIRNTFEKGGSLDDFIVGQTDNHSKFLIPEKLYGRERELAQLFSIFEAIKANGGQAVVTITGASGVGKSRLAHELERPVVEAQGRFAEGKFDQHRPCMPFHALIQALQGLIQQVLSESEHRLDKFRKKIIEETGLEATVLVEAIPEIAMLLGPEFLAAESHISMSAIEREERFKAILVKLLFQFGPKGRPLVLFLVSLDWPKILTIG